MTIEADIESGLFKHALLLDLTGDPPIAWPNTDFTPAGTYVRVDHLPNRTTRLVMNGAGPHLRQGILQLTVVTPLNAGPTTATGLAADIAEHFPADLPLYEGEVKIRVQKAPDVTPAERTGISWDVRVDVYYEAFA